jgi:flagellar hook-basal body complex protein FliE
MKPLGATAGKTAGAAPAGADFASTLKAAASEAVSALEKSETTAIAGIEGKAGVQQVVDQVMAAERTLSATLAIRNKLVAAWQEISRMQI